MDAAFAIDYERGLAGLRSESYEAIVAAINDDMPHAWLARYERMCLGPTNVFVVAEHGFSYLFDFSAELIANGALPAVPGREDRVVVAFGWSGPSAGARPKSRIAGFPGSDERGDRGHFLAHAAGGGVDINLFHQNAALNRGWSPQGKRYTAMERYVARAPGIFCFSRPIYSDGTARPSYIEFGVLRLDHTFWVELFANESH